MKKTVLIFAALLCYLTILAQNVGIGTTTPLARLHVADSSVVFDGGPLWYLPLPAGNTPVTGAGVRMLWYPGKAAFRTGAVSGDLWNKDSIGKYSFASGLDVKAKGDYAAAFGVNNNALEWYTFAAGGENTAAAAGAIAMGLFNTSRNMFSVSIGNNLISKSLGNTVLGSYNDTADTQRPVGSSDVGDRIFQVGNGNAFTRSNAITVLRNGNTGIGVVNPAAKLHVNNSAVFTGGAWNLPAAAGNPPVENEGVRMLWYADKAAFRTGAVSSNAWNKDEIGVYSFAAGLDSKAKGDYSAAIGVNNNSLDWYSFTAGVANTAAAVSAVAMGNNNKSRNFNAVAIGNDLITKTVSGISLGSFNDTADLQPAIGSSFITDRIFQIGNGTGLGRSNAITVLRNGKTGIGTVNPAAVLHVADSSVVFAGSGQSAASPAHPPVSGSGKRMMWYADRVAFRAGYVNADQWNKDNTGDYTAAFGYDTKASSIGSFASGIGATASSFTSVAMGYLVTASGVYSTAFGYNATASGYYSIVAGGNTTASGSYTAAFGENTFAKAVGGVATGRFNDISDNPNSFTAQSADRIFQVGNGTDNSTRSNALTILRNGNIGIGTLNPAKPISFPPALGEKILLYPGTGGEVGIGVYGNELRLHCDNPGSMVSFGTQDNAGNFTQAGRFQISGGYALYINGSIWANGTTYASDERFKQNITAIAAPLQKLLQLNGVEYEMKAGVFPQNNFKGGRQIGLLAQNVEKIIPEAVHELDGYKGVDYAKLVPLLIESIKEQQRQLDEQKKMIEALLKK